MSVIGHADRAGPLRDYCVGLMMPGERKSVEPMAAVTAPARTAAQHQSLLHFVGKGLVGRGGFGQGARDGAAGDRASRTDRGLDHRRHRFSQDRGDTRSGWRGSIAASSASRTIARSRCRCRLPITTPACRWPIAVSAGRLGERSRTSRKAGVPEDIGFKTKPEIALEQIACGLCGRPAARRGADGRRLWQQHRFAQRDSPRWD